VSYEYKFVIESQILFIQNFYIKKIFIHIFIRNCRSPTYLFMNELYDFLFYEYSYLFKQNVKRVPIIVIC